MYRFKKINSWFSKAIRFPITNEGGHFSLERITSDAFLFSAALVSVLSCIFNFLEGFDIVLSAFTVFSSLLLIVLYYFSRFRNSYNIWLSAVTVLLLLSVSWFMNGGAVGSVPFMYLCTVLILNFIARPEQQNSLFVMVLLNIVLLYALEYYAGDKLVRSYPNRSIYYFDMIFVFVIILFCVFLSTRFIKRSYDKERNLVKERTSELEISNEKRTNVFINLAHETKTPLTLIMNYLEEYIKKNGKEGDEDLKLLKISVDNLAKDIVNFFDMEKIQKGVSMYDHHQVSDFSEILNTNVKLFQVFAAKKRIEVISHISTNIYIKADPSAIIRIVNNLIENAVKYTPESGSVEVDLSVEDEQILFFVKDNGIGIPSSKHQKIFEPYFQVNSEKANFQGIGLGLSIVKKIVEELNGSIEIESDPEKIRGTRMKVSLPLHRKHETDVVVTAPAQSVYLEVDALNITEQAFDEDRFSIMVVEDDVSLLNYMVNALQKKFNVYYALNGKEAIEKLKAIGHLDLMVSDVMMDHGDGFFLYEQMLSSKKFNHIPFIFLTAKYSKDDRIEGLSKGAIDYISKPVSITELDKKINAILRNLITQRDAVITNAYNTLIRNKPQPVPAEASTETFGSNCVKYNLTSREVDVIKLLVQGKINKEIAGMLFISVDTVKKHLQNAYDKVGVHNKFELFKKLTG